MEKKDDFNALLDLVNELTTTQTRMIEGAPRVAEVTQETAQCSGVHIQLPPQGLAPMFPSPDQVEEDLVDLPDIALKDILLGGFGNILSILSGTCGLTVRYAKTGSAQYKFCISGSMNERDVRTLYERLKGLPAIQCRLQS